MLDMSIDTEVFAWLIEIAQVEELEDHNTIYSRQAFVDKLISLD